ncbi:hypothetical protein CDAR_497571 [Caerostris darwini]|uniref:Uncharacterized protein n=1 Tax=Caerostris darwini TaxID=1538125 RepID=A0AAV4S1Q5_9ARAC|nr:hypothetical protein CDAR_497571 [Caerostris darwini]
MRSTASSCRHDSRKTFENTFAIYSTNNIHSRMSRSCSQLARQTRFIPRRGGTVCIIVDARPTASSLQTGFEFHAGKQNNKSTFCMAVIYASFRRPRAETV